MGDRGRKIKKEGKATINLKEIRQSYGFSLQLMAKVLGISKGYYCKLENGTKEVSPELETKIKRRLFFKPQEDALLIASFDWVSLHFRTTDAHAVVKQILKLELSEFSLENYARYQYPVMYRYGALNLYVDTNDSEHGVLIECSGMACRELEQLLKDQGRDWYELFNDCLVFEEVLRARLVMDLPVEEAVEMPMDKVQPKASFNVTRLDLALDEFYSETGNYHLLDLFERFHEGLISTRKRSYSSQMGGKYTKAGLYNDGLTLYLGSPQSTPFFRFYEKDAERAKALGTSLDTVHNVYGYKNRFEVVLRGEKSDQFIRRYVLEYFDIAQKAVGIINANLVVFSDFQGHLDEDWYTLMNSREAYQFVMKPKVMDVTKTWTWAEKIVFPTMAFLKKDNKRKFFEMLGDAKISKRYEDYLKIKEATENKKRSQSKNKSRGSR